MAILQIVAMIITLAGSLMMLYYGIILIVRAFKQHVLWGVGYLFVPFVSLVFIIVKWQVAKTPFLKGLVWMGVALLGVGISVIAGNGSAPNLPQ